MSTASGLRVYVDGAHASPAPPLVLPATASTAEAGGGFPRSRTMRLLLSGRGIGTVGAVLGGLVGGRLVDELGNVALQIVYAEAHLVK